MNLHKDNGPLISSKNFTDQERTNAEVYFHHAEKGEIALTAASSWYGGDYFEFGSHDLNTFRDFLTAYNICGMTRFYIDPRFYAFDIFGKLEKDIGDLKPYFKPYSDQGDQLAHHQAMIAEHGLYADRCHLMQGLFEDTCTQDFKDRWRKLQNPDTACVARAYHMALEHQHPKLRQIGFAFLDCNVAQSYKTVFEFIFDMMAPNSYVYMDEGLQNPDVIAQWEQFKAALRQERGMDAVYVRNCGGFGSLWRLYPVNNPFPLNLQKREIINPPTPGYNL